MQGPLSTHSMPHSTLPGLGKPRCAARGPLLHRFDQSRGEMRREQRSERRGKRLQITPGLKEALLWLTLSKPALGERVRLELSQNPCLGEDWGLPLWSAATTEPDLVVDRTGGGPAVRLNDEGLPRLRLCSPGAYGGGAETSLRSCHRARWVLTVLRRRATILCAVGEVVAQFQWPFLSGQADRPIPLTLTAVARRTGLHLSTVSRVTRNKLLLAPRGLVELRSLFGPPNGELEEAVRELLTSEPTAGISTDARISELLGARGLPTSRRTVSKYRWALGVAGARARRGGSPAS